MLANLAPVSLAHEPVRVASCPSSRSSLLWPAWLQTTQNFKATQDKRKGACTLLYAYEPIDFCSSGAELTIHKIGGPAWGQQADFCQHSGRGKAISWPARRLRLQQLQNTFVGSALGTQIRRPAFIDPSVEYFSATQEAQAR